MPYLVTPGVTAGTLAFEWVDPAGVVRPLSGNAPIAVMVGERGLGIPEIDLAIDQLPFSAGGILRHAAIQSRTLEIPLIFGPAGSGLSLEALIDEAYEWFATADEESQTPGYFRVTRRDGTKRQVRCYYQRGLEGDGSHERAGEDWMIATVELVAADPWATSVQETTSSYGQAQLGTTLTVLNPGQLETYPIWTFNGPGSALTFTNLSTGKVFALTDDGGLTVPSGQWVTIDTRPPTHRPDLPVLGTGGISYYSKLTATGDLWSLQPGQNQFRLDASGTNGATVVGLRFLPRYRALLR